MLRHIIRLKVVGDLCIAEHTNSVFSRLIPYLLADISEKPEPAESCLFERSASVADNGHEAQGHSDDH